MSPCLLLGDAVSGYREETGAGWSRLYFGSEAVRLDSDRESMELSLYAHRSLIPTRPVHMGAGKII